MTLKDATSSEREVGQRESSRVATTTPGAPEALTLASARSDSSKDAQIRLCPDGSWSKWLSRRCVLPFMHIGPHRYEMRVIQQRKYPSTTRRGPAN